MNVHELLSACRRVADAVELVGADVVEVLPAAAARSTSPRCRDASSARSSPASRSRAGGARPAARGSTARPSSNESVETISSTTSSGTFASVVIAITAWSGFASAPTAAETMFTPWRPERGANAPDHPGLVLVAENREVLREWHEKLSPHLAPGAGGCAARRSGDLDCVLAGLDPHRHELCELENVSLSSISSIPRSAAIAGALTRLTGSSV